MITKQRENKQNEGRGLLKKGSSKYDNGGSQERLLHTAEG